MTSRRSHRKSRLGCLQCKRRKIKCDEAPPPCTNCKRHNIHCEYGAPPVYKSQQNARNKASAVTSDVARARKASSGGASIGDSSSPHMSPPLPSSSMTAATVQPTVPFAGPAAGSEGLPMSASISSTVRDGPMQIPRVLDDPSVSQARGTTAPTTDTSERRRSVGVMVSMVSPMLPSTGTDIAVSSASTGCGAPDTACSLALSDLELMHQYMSRTYTTLSQNNQHEQIWKDYVPEEALAHPFLMHGILALAALHLLSGCNNQSSLERRRKYAELATMHQHHAITAFRPALSNVTAASCTAVFAFSCVIAALAFSFSRYVGKSLQEDPLDELLQDFMLFRGVESVVQSFHEHLSNGKLAPLLRDPLVHGKLSADIFNALEKLREFNEAHVAHYSVEEWEAYREAIAQLRPSFEKSFDNLERVFRWPMVVPESYINLVRNRRPGALVILAHYSVILHKLDYVWWSEGWGAYLLETIYQSLDENWRPLIRWPVERIGLSFLLSQSHRLQHQQVRA